MIVGILIGQLVDKGLQFFVTFLVQYGLPIFEHDQFVCQTLRLGSFFTSRYDVEVLGAHLQHLQKYLHDLVIHGGHPIS